MRAMSHQPVVHRREQDSEHRNADDPGGIRPQRPQQRRAQRKDDERGALVLGIEKRNRRAAGDGLASSLDAQHATQRLPVNRDRDEIVAGRDLVYRAAESTKLLENIFRSVNIALVNELKIVYAAMGIDVWEVIEAAKTKPFGFMPFYPGPGLGGHCIPIDPFYLTWKSREYGQNTKFIELAGEVNTAMPKYVVSRVIDALNDRSRSLKGSRVLLLLVEPGEVEVVLHVPGMRSDLLLVVLDLRAE